MQYHDSGLNNNAFRKKHHCGRNGGKGPPETDRSLPESTLAEAMEIAERIRRKFSRKTFSPEPGKVIGKTVGIGASQLVSGEKAKTLLSRADRNPYRAKRNGKNRVTDGEGCKFNFPSCNINPE
jgi:diguanylate cyclase